MPINLSNLNEKTLVVTASGCGASFAKLLEQPGVSKWVNGIYLPYSNKAVNQHLSNSTIVLLQNNKISYVSEVVSTELAESHWYLADISIGITAALPTNRERKGNNHAYISIMSDDKINTYYIKFRKEESYQLANQCRLRKLYDEALMIYSGSLAIDGPDYLEHMYVGDPCVKEFRKLN